MHYPALLRQFRQNHPQFSRSLASNSLLLALAILQARTVNLYVLRETIGPLLGTTSRQLDSHYKRLTRFLCQQAASEAWLALLRLAFSLLALPTHKHLYLDGTEWAIGRFDLHLLVLAIDYHGVAIPVYVRVYEHVGVLSEADRIDFMQAACACWPLQGAYLMADREFIGQQWFAALAALELRMVIRLRKNQHKKQLCGKTSYAALQKRATQRGQASGLLRLQGRHYRLWILATRQADEPLMYLLTNALQEPAVGELYRLRWKIETCFKHLKSNGFNLEALRLQQPGKIRLVFAVLVLVYVLSLQAGVTNQQGPKAEYRAKKHYRKGKPYPAISLVKLGTGCLKQVLFHPGRLALTNLLLYLRHLPKPKSSLTARTCHFVQ